LTPDKDAEASPIRRWMRHHKAILTTLGTLSTSASMAPTSPTMETALARSWKLRSKATRTIYAYDMKNKRWQKTRFLERTLRRARGTVISRV